MNWLAIALGGALGALGRYFIVAHAFPVLPNRFPVGTLAANVIGCCLIGIFYVVIIERNLLGPQWRLFIITGLLGAFTTFSAFSLETLQLWQYGHNALAAAYVLISIASCIAATALAVVVTTRLLT